MGLLCWEDTDVRSYIGMEYTSLIYGVFMKTLRTGTPKGALEALGGLGPWAFAISMNTDLPSDTNSKETVTRTQDIGKLVAAALDLESCEEEIGWVGKTMK